MSRLTHIKLDTPRKKNALVGYLYEKDNWYIFMKRIRRDKHYMNIVKGYGLQEEVWDKWLKKPPKGKSAWVWIFEEDTNTHLMAPISTWKDKSRVMEFNKDDGKQRFLSEKYMFSAKGIEETINKMKNTKVSDV